MRPFVIFFAVFFQVSLCFAQDSPALVSDTSMQIQKVLLCECVDYPDVTTSFPGGQDSLESWFKANLTYPEESMKYGEHGSVQVGFVIEPDGSVTNVEVISGITAELDFEAVRLVKNMPKWIPEEVKGQLVRSRCSIPITFKLL